MEFKGSLPSDSPSLTKKLLRTFSTRDCQRLFRAYQLAWESDPRRLSEESSKRSPGSSYNPGPARVLEILLAETKSPIHLIGAAVLSFARVEVLSAEEKTLYHRELEALKEAQNLISAAEFKPIAQENPYNLAMAIQLDQLRHMHLAEIESQKTLKMLVTARRLLDISKTKGTCTLQKKLKLALNRCERRHYTD